MPPESNANSPEKKVTVDDNARKFIIERFDEDFLDSHNASSFILTTDWLETNEDDETKLAHKEFKNGDIQILLISKVIKDGKRTSNKEPLSQEAYEELLQTSVLHLAKERYEFDYEQDGITFSIKYDEFQNGEFCILEVDASSDEERALFDLSTFPYLAEEVTGDMRYYGYRVAETIK